MGVSCLANYLVFKKEALAINEFPIEVITSQNLESYLTPLEKQNNGHEQFNYQAVNI